MKHFPRWFLAVFLIVLVMYAAVNVYYRLGASGVKVSGARVSFDRQHDYALFKIDGSRAFRLGKRGDVAVVRYKRGVFPFCPLCGTYESAGSVVNLVRYRKEDWVYSDYPNQRFASVVNLRTGKTHSVKPPEPDKFEKIDPATVAVYRDNGLTFDDQHKLTPARVAKDFKSLSTINESCIVFNAAFLLVLGVLVVLGSVFLVRGLVRSRPGRERP